MAAKLDIAKGRQVIYDLYKNDKVQPHFQANIRTYDMDKDLKIDERIGNFIESLLKRSGEPEGEAKKEKIDAVKAYLKHKQERAEEQKDNEKGMKLFFKKITEKTFKSEDEKKENIRKKEEELQAKIAQENLKKTPEYKRDQLAAEIEELKKQMQPFIDQNRAFFKKPLAYRALDLEDWVEKLNNSPMKDELDKQVKEECKSILNALIAEDFESLFIADFEIFKHARIKNFVQEPPALVDQPVIPKRIFTEVDLDSFNDIAENYSLKDDRKTLEENNEKIANFKKQIAQKEDEIEKLFPKKEVKAQPGKEGIELDEVEQEVILASLQKKDDAVKGPAIGVNNAPVNPKDDEEEQKAILASIQEKNGVAKPAVVKQAPKQPINDAPEDEDLELAMVLEESLNKGEVVPNPANVKKKPENKPQEGDHVKVEVKPVDVKPVVEEKAKEEPVKKVEEKKQDKQEPVKNKEPSRLKKFWNWIVKLFSCCFKKADKKEADNK